MKTCFALLYWINNDAEFPIVGKFSRSLVDLFSMKYSQFDGCYLYMILKFGPTGVELVEFGGSSQKK